MSTTTHVWPDAMAKLSANKYAKLKIRTFVYVAVNFLQSDVTLVLSITSAKRTVKALKIADKESTGYRATATLTTNPSNVQMVRSMTTNVKPDANANIDARRSIVKRELTSLIKSSNTKTKRTVRLDLEETIKIVHQEPLQETLKNLQVDKGKEQITNRFSRIC